MNTNENINNSKLKKRKKLNIAGRKVRIFLIILILSIITSGIFLRFHMVSDTYWNIGEGYEKYKFYPLEDGRIINYLMIYLAQLINIPFEIYQLIMMIGSILCYSFSVYILYNFLIEKLNKNEKIIKLITLLGSFLVIYNPFTVESFAYTEMIIPLSTFLYTKAAILLNSEHKKNYVIKTMLIVMLACLCYQGTICIFPTISIFIFALQEKAKLKEWIKYLAKVAVIYAVGIIFMVIVLHVANTFLGKSQTRLSVSTDILELIKQFIIITIYFIIEIPYNLCPKDLNILSIFIFLILLIVILRKRNISDILRNVLKYIMIIIVAICFVTCLIFAEGSLSISARTANSIGTIIGMSIIYVLFKYIEYSYKPKEKTETKTIEYDNIFVILIALCIVFILINIYNYNNLAIQNIITKNQDEIYCDLINDCINEYEQKNNIKVKYVVFTREIPYYDTYFNFSENIFTAKGIVAKYSDVHCLNYYTGRNLVEKEKDNEEYNKLYKNDNVNYHEFNKNQIKFINETVYIRIY